MNVETLLVTLVALALFSYVFGKQRALSIAKHNRHSLQLATQDLIDSVFVAHHLKLKCI